MKKYLLAAVLASTAIGGIAYAAQEAPEGRPHGGGMMRMDANHDGVITREEAIAQATERFDRMDANHDGKIDRTEMANLRERAHERRGDADNRMPPPPTPAPPAGDQ